MHSTESIRSSSVINVIKWEIDTRRVTRWVENVHNYKCIRGGWKMYITISVLSTIVKPCTSLPENSPDFNDLENWSLSKSVVIWNNYSLVSCSTLQVTCPGVGLSDLSSRDNIFFNLVKDNMLASYQKQLKHHLNKIKLYLAGNFNGYLSTPTYQLFKSTTLQLYLLLKPCINWKSFT